MKVDRKPGNNSVGAALIKILKKGTEFVVFFFFSFLFFFLARPRGHRRPQEKSGRRRRAGDQSAAERQAAQTRRGCYRVFLPSFSSVCVCVCVCACAFGSCRPGTALFVVDPSHGRLIALVCPQVRGASVDKKKTR